MQSLNIRVRDGLLGCDLPGEVPLNVVANVIRHGAAELLRDLEKERRRQAALKALQTLRVASPRYGGTAMDIFSVEAHS